MKFRPFFYFALFFFALPAYGQLSLTDPLICHDRNNYLRCYNDGSCVLTFSNGNFKKFRTADNAFSYSDTEREIIFLRKRWDDPTSTDTVRIIQLPRSILVRKGTSSLEITSLKNIPRAIEDYGIGPYSVDSAVRGLTFWSGERWIRLEVWTYEKTWSWSIIMQENNRQVLIDYNGYKHNRLERILIQDDSLRYGMALSTTFKSLKKIWRLQSIYIDTLRILKNGVPAIGAVPLSKEYRYEYRKTGRLNYMPAAGELKLCDCD